MDTASWVQDLEFRFFEGVVSESEFWTLFDILDAKAEAEAKTND